MSVGLEFGILGPLEVRVDGELLRVGGLRQRALLALLLCNANQIVSRDRLIDELLSDQSSRSADRMLRVQISRLRKALAMGDGEPRVVSRPPGFLLRVEAGELDLRAFERCVAEGRDALEHGDAGEAADGLRKAESLWRGRPLADLESQPFARVEVLRLEELRLGALEDRIDADLSLGRHAGLCSELERLVAEHPLRERLRAQLMVALYRCGRQADALAVYRRTSELLREQLGLSPGPALRELEHLILTHDPSLEGARTAAGMNGAGRRDVCPFKGLASFDRADVEFFCGRDRLVSDLVARLAESPVVGILGPSGIGKSSLLRAGLLPALSAGVLPGSARWRQVLLRPGEHPTAELERKAGSGDLNGLLAGFSSGDRLVVAVDQLEELFSVCRCEDEREAFLQQLTAAARDSEGRAIVVVVLRADFYGRLASYPRFAGLVSRSHLLVGPMDRLELASAVEQPANRVGLGIDHRLVDALVDDVADEPGGLPLLSTTLLELWRRRDDHQLRYESYRQSGGVRGAVARLAEDAYAQLNERERRVARGVMLRLVSDERGALARRRVPVHEFESLEGAGHVLETLIDARLLTASDGEIELSHEALLHEWPRYRTLLEEDQVGRRLHAHLATAASEWDVRGRDQADLYRGARLGAALEWAAQHDDQLNTLEREFIDASRRRAEQETRRQRSLNRRLRGLLLGVGALLVVAVLAGIVALANQHNASREASVAKSRALAAESQTQLSIDPERSILLAAAAVRTAVTPQAMFALRAAIDASPIRARLPDVAPQPCGPATTATPGPLSPGVAFNPDGSQVAEALCDGTVVLASARSGRVVRRVQLGRGLAGRLVYNRASSLLVATGAGRVAAIDPATGAVRERGPAVGGFTGLASTPSAPVVAFAGKHGVTLWNLRTRAARTIALPRGLTAAMLGFSPDGRRLAIALNVFGNQRIVGLVLDTRTGRILATLTTHSALQWDDLAFSPDGRELVVGELEAPNGGGAVVLRDARTLALRQVLLRFAGGKQTPAVAFSPDGSRIAYGTVDGTAGLVSAASGQKIVSYLGHTAPISQIAFSPDGQLVMTGSTDGTVRVWRGQGLELRSAPGTSTYPWSIVPLAAGFAGIGFSPSSLTAQLWSGELRPAAPSLTLTRNASAGFVLPSAGPLAGIIPGDPGNSGRILIWNTLERRVIRRVPPTRLPDHSALLSPDGTTIAAALPVGAGWTSELLDTRTGRYRTLARTNCSAGPKFAFSRDGRLVAAGGACGHADVWNVASGQRLGRPVTVGAGTLIGRPAFNPNGRQLALPASDDAVTVINPLTGATLAVLTDHTRLVNAAAYSPDGHYLATTSDDGTADIYDAHTFTLLRTIHDTGAVSGAVFTPNSRNLLTWDSNSTIAEWDACTYCQNPHALLALAATHVTRQLTPSERRTFGVG